MRKAVLFTVLEPKKEGESPKLYYVGENKFTTNVSDAHIFTDRDELLEVQNKFDFDLQLEYLEH